MKIFQALVISVSLLWNATGDFTLSFQFHRYSNPSDRDVNGNCCDTAPGVICGSCDTHFKSLCLRNGGTSHSQTGQCIPGTVLSPGGVGGSSVNFSAHIGVISNPFGYNKSGNILQSGFQLYLEVWDDDYAFNDDLIDRIVFDILNRTSSQISHTAIGVFNRVSLLSSYRLLCSVNYYGFDCSVLCIPYNDDTNGHYTCNSTTGAKKCREGWQNVTNNCTNVACNLVCRSPGGTCTHNGTCQCTIGWSGDGCDIPQCIEGCHPQGGYCTEPYQCLCYNNWNGSLCNESFCTVNCSSIGGQCLVPDECTCFAGYTGATCEIDLLPCDHQMPCLNGGHCSHTKSPGEYVCSCQVGYMGMNCEVNIDSCAPQPCLNNGTCINEDPGNYSCICLAGWTGKSCHFSIEYCESNPCINNGTCVNLPNAYYCNCSSQYEGLNCELAVNACLPDPCQNNSTCINHVTSYSCECNEGFTGHDCESIISSSYTTASLPSPSANPPTTTIDTTTSQTIVGPIVGGIVGSLFLTILLITAFVAVSVIASCFKKRKMRNHKEIHTSDAMDNVATITPLPNPSYAVIQRAYGDNDEDLYI
uniref:Delta5 n=1 Tax=Amphimedon queenslandica TaxID=400682 RepID=F6JTJ0_AMPQE|nr:Delta5 [Amphimedon queenslandica]